MMYLIYLASGYCCVEYSVCDMPNSFSFDTSQDDAMLNTDCTSDYIRIEGAASTCQATPLIATNKFCGIVFSATEDADVESDILCGMRII